MLTTPTATTEAQQAAALGFADQPNEIVVASLPIEGEIPEWLTGSLLRNGPARWDLASGTVNHWFDGMAMLHRFAFSGGTVSYANKLLRGRAATAHEATGKLAYREFASDPCRSTFGRFMSLFSPNITDNAAVNITKIGEEWLAITETPMAIEFDPRTLDTLGVRRVASGTRVPVAHPHVDAARGELVGLRVAFGRRTTYEITATDLTSGAERLIGSVPAARPAYQHSFALTERHVIIGEHPLVVNPLRLAFSGKPFIENYEWKPELGTRFLALDRESGAVVGEWSAPASFCFHHVNAFDDDGAAIVLDLAEFDDVSIIDALSIANRRAAAPAPTAELRRYRLTPGRPDAERLPVPEAEIELPRIDDRFARRPYSVVYGAGFSDQGDGFFDRITRVDLADGSVTHAHWPGEIPGEPVFVARPESEREGDGVVLTVVLEPGRSASSLVVLDGTTLAELGRARVPQHVPLGFHGGFSRTI